MSQLHYSKKGGSKTFSLRIIPLTAAGVLLNFLFSRLATGLSLPLYLDNVGTILAGALGGYLPGITVGLVNNFINMSTDANSIYYAVLSILIGTLAALYSQKRYYFRFPHVLIPILSFAAVGGGLGSLLTWFLYGGDIGGLAAPLAHRLLDAGLGSEAAAQLTADLLIDLADKSLTVLLVLPILRLLPEKIRDWYNQDGWRDQAETNSIRDAKHRSSHWRISLRGVVALLLGGVMIGLVAVISFVSILQYREANISEHAIFARDLARTIGQLIDPERVDDYIARGDQAEGYRETEEAMQKILNSSDDIQYIYAYRILEDGCQVVFDLDTAEVLGGEPGSIIPFDESFTELLPALKTGEKIEPIASDDTYGWLLTAYSPVYNTAGECVCYAGADLSMPRLIDAEKMFITKIISLFLAFFSVAIAVGIHLAKYRIVNPINAMANAASDFAYNDETARKETVRRIGALGVNTGDEIENLYHALAKTTEDTAAYIDSVQEKNETINRMQNGLIYVIADLVESRDETTGDHIRKTANYVRIIAREMQREGLYSDTITDAWIDDIIRSAPMHDIGKIRIPDALLNKRGKLTQEEFERMKLHTVYGREVIDNAILSMREQDTSYLKEARNMALRHHEKWNGGGYPDGLAGEEIPLSARIMAVADVFDALVSRRSYKEPFSFEEAVNIIRKDAGTHFDPSVVKAFLAREEEVRQVARMQAEGNPFPPDIIS